MPKIKLTKYFLWRINGVSLYCQVVIATKTKPGNNLTDEIFHWQKIPELQYNEVMDDKELFCQSLWNGNYVEWTGKVGVWQDTLLVPISLAEASQESKYM